MPSTTSVTEESPIQLADALNKELEQIIQGMNGLREVVPGVKTIEDQNEDLKKRLSEALDFLMRLRALSPSPTGTLSKMVQEAEGMRTDLDRVLQLLLSIDDQVTPEGAKRSDPCAGNDTPPSPAPPRYVTPPSPSASRYGGITETEFPDVDDHERVPGADVVFDDKFDNELEVFDAFLRSLFLIFLAVFMMYHHDTLEDSFMQRHVRN